MFLLSFIVVPYFFIAACSREQPPNIGRRLNAFTKHILRFLTSRCCLLRSGMCYVQYSFVCSSVYILTDDQDLKLGSLEVQDKVQKLLVQEGMVFQNAFVTTPVCCPSRYVAS